MKGALEAYLNTIDTDYDDNDMGMAYDFHEQGLSCQSEEDTMTPSAKRYRRSIDWNMKASIARLQCLNRSDKQALHNRMKQSWVKRWIASRPDTWQIRTDLNYGDKRALAHNAFLLLGEAERRRQCLLFFDPDHYKKRNCVHCRGINERRSQRSRDDVFAERAIACMDVHAP